ncbi:hypothetical protein C8J57DRAFT_1252975 [Mycena rebaudengoi]|nr:hypothetical protein C8J57DRAFT_1252975 [Mycena rebaudengoi]
MLGPESAEKERNKIILAYRRGRYVVSVGRRQRIWRRGRIGMSSIMVHVTTRRWCTASGFEGRKSRAAGLGMHGGGGALIPAQMEKSWDELRHLPFNTPLPRHLNRDDDQRRQNGRLRCWGRRRTIGGTAEDASRKIRCGPRLRVSSEGEDGLVRSLAQPGAQKRSQKPAVTKKRAGSAVLDGERSRKEGDGEDVP